MVLSKYLLYSAGSIVGAIVFGEIYHHCALKLKEKLLPNEEFIDIFYTRRILEEKSPLTQNIAFIRDNVERSGEVIQNIIQSATKTIHLAMYIFTSRSLVQELVNARGRGVEVFVIIDKSMQDSSCKTIQQLLQNEITVKILDPKRVCTMHLKLCLIDVPFDIQKKKLVPPKTTSSPSGTIFIPPKTGLTVTGSLNWTMEGLTCNAENFVVTSSERVCHKSATQFFDLWNKAERILE